MWQCEGSRGLCVWRTLKDPMRTYIFFKGGINLVGGVIMRGFRILSNNMFFIHVFWTSLTQIKIYTRLPIFPHKFFMNKNHWIIVTAFKNCLLRIDKFLKAGKIMEALGLRFRPLAPMSPFHWVTFVLKREWTENYLRKSTKGTPIQQQINFWYRKYLVVFVNCIGANLFFFQL